MLREIADRLFQDDGTIVCLQEIFQKGRQDAGGLKRSGTL